MTQIDGGGIDGIVVVMEPEHLRDQYSPKIVRGDAADELDDDIADARDV